MRQRGREKQEKEMEERSEGQIFCFTSQLPRFLSSKDCFQEKKCPGGIESIISLTFEGHHGRFHRSERIGGMCTPVLRLRVFPRACSIYSNLVT